MEVTLSPAWPSAATRPTRTSKAVPSDHDSSVPLAQAQLGVAAEGLTFAQVLKSNHDFIWRLLRRLGVPDHAVEDSVQDVFWIYARKQQSVKPGSERSYLFGIALRKAAQVKTAQARNREDLLCGDDWPSAGQSGAVQEAHLEARQLLDLVLDGMKEDVRAVFVLFRLEGLEIAEIATLLSIPKGTVSSRLRRGREQFQASAARLRAQLSFEEQQR